MLPVAGPVAGTLHTSPRFQGAATDVVALSTGVFCVASMLIVQPTCSEGVLTSTEQWHCLEVVLPDAAPRKCRLQHSNLHDDYITCLAAAQHNYMVVTAGLRGELGFWDVHKGLEVSRHPQVRIRAMSSHVLIRS